MLGRLCAFGINNLSAGDMEATSNGRDMDLAGIPHMSTIT